MSATLTGGYLEPTPCQRLYSPRPRARKRAFALTECDSRTGASSAPANRSSWAEEPGRRPKSEFLQGWRFPKADSRWGLRGAGGSSSWRAGGEEARSCSGPSPARLPDPNMWQVPGWGRAPPRGHPAATVHGLTQPAAGVTDTESRQARVPETLSGGWGEVRGVVPRVYALGTIRNPQGRDTAERHALWLNCLVLPAGDAGPEQHRGTAELTGQRVAPGAVALPPPAVWPCFPPPRREHRSPGPGLAPCGAPASGPHAPHTPVTDFLPLHRRADGAARVWGQCPGRQRRVGVPGTCLLGRGGAN